MHETRVQAMIREDPTCHRAAKPMHPNLRVLNLIEPVLESPGAPTTEPMYCNYGSLPAQEPVVRNKRRPSN